jgi:hypothetical protein
MISDYMEKVKENVISVQEIAVNSTRAILVVDFMENMGLV